MAKGILGIIACPMLDDNLVYSLSNDPEEKTVAVVDNPYNTSIRRKLEEKGVAYETIAWDDFVSGMYTPDRDRFNVVIVMINLGLHAVPEKLKDLVEDMTRDISPHVDAFGFYLGTCGNYEWNLPAWCKENGLKPATTFFDGEGHLCHDCVGIAISGGPRYLELQHKYMGHLYIFPAMATNFDEFMEADSAGSSMPMESLTDDMREALGIEPGRDGYLRWLLGLGGYEYILRLDTGLGDKEQFDRDIQRVADRTHLKIKQAEDGWATIQPTIDMYDRCKALLS